MPRNAISIVMDFSLEDISHLRAEGVTDAEGAMMWAARRLQDKARSVAERGPVILVENATFHIEYNIHGHGEVPVPISGEKLTRIQLLLEE